MSHHESPLAGYEGAPPLPSGLNPNAKSLANNPAPLSVAYQEFPKLIDPSKGFDFHIYYMPSSQEQTQYARELHERIRREFPEASTSLALSIYRFWDRPVGPHPTAMFEVNTFTPHQTGALFSWLAVHRGTCDVLIHPNTGDPYRDHTELATWMGKQWPLYTDMLRKISQRLQDSGVRG
ncbi:hypothetical protein BS17DRAFT_704438 [Gyrodon lividus]|nr:hypothetical protein BS17DRAFT_704438 [Gyrodon lividus]